MKIILDDKDYKCTWPDGESRTVRVHKIIHGIAWVLWNDKHEPMEIPNPPGPPLISDTVGCTDQVPMVWLEEIDA